MGEPDDRIKLWFCFGHTSFLTPHRKQKRNTDKGFSNFAFWGRKKWMEIPEETNHPTAVTMATDSGSNALHRSSARADTGRQGKGWARLAGLVHSTNLRHSGRTWTFVEFVRLWVTEGIKAGTKLSILLPQSPGCWTFRYESLCLASLLWSTMEY